MGAPQNTLTMARLGTSTGHRPEHHERSTQTTRTAGDGFDVIIVGSGTAGLTTALSLLNRGRLKIAVVDRADRRTPQAVELLPEQARSVLQRLKLWRPFLAEHHLRTMVRHSGRPTLAGQTFIYDPDQQGWTIERAWFDEMLAREAAARGVAMWSNCGLRGDRDSTELYLLPPGHSPLPIKGRFVIDATGARASYARRRGARREILDRLAGVTIRFSATRPANLPNVEPWSHGWWFTDQRPFGQLLVSCMTDPRMVAPLGLTSLRTWSALLEQTYVTRQAVGMGWMMSLPQMHPASCHRLDPMIGSDWLAIDEAAFGLHPLGDHSLMKTLDTAERAADAVFEHLHGRSGLARYAHRVAGEYNRYVQALAGYYADERHRWPNRNFWRQRRTVM